MYPNMARIYLRRLQVLSCCALLLGCAAPSSPHQVLETQASAWNRGDIEAFMETYARDISFSSGGETRRGWEQVLSRYRRRYPDREAMGTLSFSELEIHELSDRAAWLTGRWRLEREADAPHGVFTLILRRDAGGWRIIHDHTSAAGE